MPPETTRREASRPPGRGVVGAIPARYASTRLPAKVLRPIAGRPMIEHVYDRARRAVRLDRVVVLTDDERIGEAVSRFGGEWEMTPAACASGTDRIAWAARGWSAAAVINVQGDQPLLDPAALDRMAAHLLEHPEDPLVTLAAPAGPGDRDDPHVVKVVTDLSGRALYFSRAPIPYPQTAGGRGALHHLGVYGYQLSALLELAALPPTPLERSESLEQLRALENGMPMRVLEVESAWGSVDTMDDLERVERLFAARATTAERSA